MAHWDRSHFGPNAAASLVDDGLVPTLVDVVEWRVPGDEVLLALMAGYVVSFGYFHEHGFASPYNRFFRGLLHHYG